MKVLSLFDGISCGRLALDRAEIPVEEYHAFEIDEYAIQISKKNYPDIIHHGDVLDSDFSEFKGFDLLIGGSPCQSLSIVQSKTRQHLNGKSKLFFEFVRALGMVKPKYFLFENVASMNKESKATITELLGVEPVLIDSAVFSAQSRPRLYWTNINITKGHLPFIAYKNKKLILDSILEDNVDEKYFYKYNFDFHGENNTVAATLRMNNYAYDMLKRVNSRYKKCQALLACGGGNTQRKVYINGRCRKLTPLEYERLQTLPDNYTEGISNTQRYKCVGNGWTVDVIAWILKSIKEEAEKKTK